MPFRHFLLFFNEKNAETAFFHEHIFGQANIQLGHGIGFIKTGLKLDFSESELDFSSSNDRIIQFEKISGFKFGFINRIFY
jgi:hypothetical protein